MEYILSGALLLTFCMWAWREYQHDQERKDLLNRLMAKDFNEYVIQGKPPPKGGNFIARGLAQHFNAGKEGD